jgi:hypothetical protein
MRGGSSNRSSRGISYSERVGLFGSSPNYESQDFIPGMESYGSHGSTSASVIPNLQSGYSSHL